MMKPKLILCHMVLIFFCTGNRCMLLFHNMNGSNVYEN